jgi:hypothetical protein
MTTLLTKRFVFLLSMLGLLALAEHDPAYQREAGDSLHHS